ncbi:sensor histidine kinase [Nocardiopsis metallicus]|uniref:histidine kinase n=1 Tax=Nocardiopsis metallicus TaxID=179819 RepID=A0A840W4P9_9ACTN|nr:ATP-binding protein [Nocardiopsis metallicus]MBB5491909.1 signal transduction histidine kinase/xanthosine utilization system XapX-like protein [Nocardiopsis metallicus]
MAVHLSDRKRPLPRPGQQALVALLVTSALVAPAWSWTVIESPEPARPVIALVGGVVGLLLCAAVATAVYQAAVARIARAHSTRVSGGARTLEEEAGWVVDALLPALAHAAREGNPVKTVLSEHPRPTHPTVDRLAHAVATQVADAEQRSAEDRAARTEIENEVIDLANAALPLIVHRVRQDRTIAVEVLNQEFQNVHPPVAHLRRRVLEEILAGERRCATALVSAANSGGRIQAHLTTLLAQLRTLEERYGDRPDIFHDLLAVDHNVARTGRLADAFVVLAQGRSGRRWTRPIVMESILRGAMGRITAFRRVRLHYTSKVAVVGYAAEGVMQALAELMDNAANFSANGTEVHVYVQEEDTGVTITVEDSGLGLRHRERRIAENLIAEPRTLATLPGTRMGLAVVGCLADKYGLTVSFRPSARGGIGVVVLIPPNLITEPRIPERRPLADAPPPVSAPADPAEGTPARGVPTAHTPPNGTPRPVPRAAPQPEVPAASAPSVADAHSGPNRSLRAPTHQGPAAPASTNQGPADQEPTEKGTGRPPLARRDAARPAPAAGDAERPAQPVNLPQRRRGHTLAEAVRENPEQLFPTRRRSFDPRARNELPTRFAAFRDAGDTDGSPEGDGPDTTWEDRR